MVREYAANTHAATHTQYTLNVKHVFRASREGEAASFRRSVGNRQLLWHGSRLTNWVGILSQGLRIAPPEAPVTGYMCAWHPSHCQHGVPNPDVSPHIGRPGRFGKGVYFADMVSKSANYCMGSRDSPTAVLLLCDVALGAAHELIASQCEPPAPSLVSSTHLMLLASPHS